MEAAVKDLTQASHRLAEVLYRNAAASAGQSEPPKAAEEPKQNGVVDAEVVDEKK